MLSFWQLSWCQGHAPGAGIRGQWHTVPTQNDLPSMRRKWIGQKKSSGDFARISPRLLDKAACNCCWSRISFTNQNLNFSISVMGQAGCRWTDAGSNKLFAVCISELHCLNIFCLFLKQNIYIQYILFKKLCIYKNVFIIYCVFIYFYYLHYCALYHTNKITNISVKLEFSYLKELLYTANLYKPEHIRLKGMHKFNVMTCIWICDKYAFLKSFGLAFSSCHSVNW